MLFCDLGSAYFLHPTRWSIILVQKEKPSEDGDKKKAKRPDLKAITKVSEDAMSLWLLFRNFTYVTSWGVTSNRATLYE